MYGLRNMCDKKSTIFQEFLSYLLKYLFYLPIFLKMRTGKLRFQLAMHEGNIWISLILSMKQTQLFFKLGLENIMNANYGFTVY